VASSTFRLPAASCRGGHGMPFRVHFDPMTIEFRFSDHRSGQPFILKYCVAVLSVTASLMLTLWMRTKLGQASTPIWVLFLCAIIGSAWIAGFKSGLLSIALSLLAIVYFFATPFNSFAVDLKEIPRIVIFTLSALVVLSLLHTREQQLRQSEDRLRLVINTIPIMTWSVQADGAVDFANRTKMIDKWMACMAAAVPYEAEMRLQRADASIADFWFAPSL